MTPAEEFATRVAATFGTIPRWHGRELRVFCPCHEADGGDHSPSLAVWNSPAGYFFKCMTGCRARDVRSALAARGIASYGNANTQVSVEARAKARQAEEDRRIEQLGRVRSMVGDSRVVAVGDPADLYLKSRKLDGILREFEGLRTIRSYGNEGAMLSVICDLRTLKQPQPLAVGCQTLKLDAEGRPSLVNGKKFRSIVGTQRGFGVPYGQPGPHLVVAEGVETMLAAMKLLDVFFGVATLSASNMAPLVVPEWVTRVTIAMDDDAPGIASANALSNSLTEAGVPVKCEFWGKSLGDGWDAADEWGERDEA